MSLNEYNKLTLDIMSSFERTYRSRHGQFFTSYSQVDLCIKILKKYMKFTNVKILEPSCGTGQFIDKLVEVCDIKSEVYLVEKDEKFYEALHDYREHFNVEEIINMDFLQYNPEIEFDLIIGNPPYVELNKYDKIDYKSDLIKGRYNIYALFIEHSLKLLALKGIICFILPTSLMTAPSFQLLRTYIKEQCNILNITSLDNFSDDVSQDVNIYIFQKVKPRYLNINYTVDYGGIQFSLEKEPGQQDHKLIRELSSIVTGSIVWNQNKDKLVDTREEGTIRLIYSADIGHINDKKFTEHKQKKQYIKSTKSPVKLPAIFINRGKVLRHELVEEFDESLLAENHLNVINGSIENLRTINDYLLSDQCKEYIKKNSSTLNFSKTQLENLPMF